MVQIHSCPFISFLLTAAYGYRLFSCHFLDGPRTKTYQLLMHLGKSEPVQTSWLDEKRNPDKPFFLNIWFHKPHAPLAAPETIVSQYGELKDPAAIYSGTIDNTDRAVHHHLTSVIHRSPASDLCSTPLGVAMVLKLALFGFVFSPPRPIKISINHY